jgi:hypothetical protein
MLVVVLVVVSVILVHLVDLLVVLEAVVHQDQQALVQEVDKMQLLIPVAVAVVPKPKVVKVIMFAVVLVDLVLLF